MKSIILLVGEAHYDRHAVAAVERGQTLPDLIRSWLQEQADRRQAESEAPAFSREQLEEMLRMLDSREA